MDPVEGPSENVPKGAGVFVLFFGTKVMVKGSTSIKNYGGRASFVSPQATDSFLPFVGVAHVRTVSPDIPPTSAGFHFD